MNVPKARHVGERRCVDAFVFCVWGGRRWLLMVERGDGLGWAAPGGGLKPGEGPAHALDRELAEETGLVLDGDAVWRVLPARRVPDPRATADAWFVTVPFVHHMGLVDVLPDVYGGTDARRAVWVSAGSYNELVASLRARFDGDVFAAHRHMLLDVFAETR